MSFLRLLLVFPLAFALIFAIFAAIGLMTRERTGETASSVAMRLPWTTVEVCGYRLSTKLSKAGYDVEQWARMWSQKGCARLDHHDHCLLRCAEQGGAPGVAGGCSAVCSETPGQGTYGAERPL
jgi:hypothetical protein